MKTRSATSGWLHVEKWKEDGAARVKGADDELGTRQGIRLSTTEISFLAIYCEKRRRKAPWVDFK